MSTDTQSYKEAFYEFANTNRAALDAVLPTNIDTLTDEDLRILCNYATYKAGAPHYDETGKIDPSLIDGIRVFFSKPEVNSKEEIRKAFSWYEKGCLNQSSLHESMFNVPEFSPKVERYLQKQRMENNTKSFKKMQESINKLGKSIREIKDLLKNSSEPLDSPAMVLKVRSQLKKIGSAMNQCDRCGRAGIAWAHRAGIPIHKSSKALHRMYLSKLPALEEAVKPVEAVLASQGIKSSLAKQINTRKFIWANDLKEVSREIKKQAHAKHQQESSYAFG